MFDFRYVRVVDHRKLGLSVSPLHSFVYDDTFCKSVGLDESLPIVRFWVHNQTVVLGIQDSRLPFISDGISFLRQLGYDVIVRNSGGLAVVLDEGILNLSLILKETKSLSIDIAFEHMVNLIKHTLRYMSDPIEAKEIVGSYCPGKYDLSMAGKKFAGISQRRIQGGVAVQIYLCVTGSGEKRAQLIQQFYQKARKNAETKITFPSIEPQTMASLSELANQNLSVAMVFEQILQALAEWNTNIRFHHELSAIESTWFDDYYEKMKARNEKFLEKG